MIENFIYVKTYEYFDEDKLEYQNRLFLLNNEFYLYEFNYSNYVFDKLNFKFDNMPEIFIVNNRLYFHSVNDLSLVIENSNSPIVISSFPNITSYCLDRTESYYSILKNKYAFYRDPQNDVYNLDFSPDDSMAINLNPEDGAVNKIIKFKKSFIIIQDYNISKLDRTSSGYTIASYCNLSSRIYADSVALIDDYVVFVSSSGIYLYDGNDAKQIFLVESKKIKGSKFKAIAFNNKYFLKTDYSLNKEIKPVILELNISEETSNIYNIGDLQDIFMLKSTNTYYLNATIKNNNENFQILTLDTTSSSAYKKYIRFNRVTLGNDYTKTLSGITIKSSGNYNLKIKSELGFVSYSVSSNFCLEGIGLLGNTFEIEIESDEYFCIYTILLKTIDAYED